MSRAKDNAERQPASQSRALGLLRPAQRVILRDMDLFRRTSIAVVAFLLAASLLGCSKHAAPSGTGQKSDSGFETLELRYQGFAGVVTYPELAEDLGYLAPIKLKYVGNTISGPQDIQTVVTGDTDFGGAFNGAVVKLVAAKAPVATFSFCPIRPATPSSAAC